jgi:hypothetical protein
VLKPQLLIDAQHNTCLIADTICTCVKRSVRSKAPAAQISTYPLLIINRHTVQAHMASSCEDLRG